PLVAAAGVEAAGDLALAVEDVPALLDPARDQHVAVDLEQILAVEVSLLDILGRLDRRGFSGYCHPLWECTPGFGPRLPSHAKGRFEHQMVDRYLRDVLDGANRRPRGTRER